MKKPFIHWPELRWLCRFPQACCRAPCSNELWRTHRGARAGPVYSDVQLVRQSCFIKNLRHIVRVYTFQIKETTPYASRPVMVRRPYIWLFYQAVKRMGNQFLLVLPNLGDTPLLHVFNCVQSNCLGNWRRTSFQSLELWPN